MTKHNLPRWNLSEYYQSLTDPKLKRDKALIERQVEKFIRDYTGKIKTGKLPAKTLLKAIKDHEQIDRTLEHIADFARFLYDTDQNNEDKAAFLQAIKELAVEIGKKLLFFPLEIKSWHKSTFNTYYHAPALKDYSYFLYDIYRFKPHTLTAPEEKILAEKSLPACSAWHRLHGETTANLEFKVKINKRSKIINLEELLSLNYSPNRLVRKAASQSLAKEFKDKSKLYTLIYNNLLLDKNQTDKLKHYSLPEESRILHDENDLAVVELIEKQTVKNYPLVAIHYNLKKKMLKLDKLFEYDRYAPLITGKEKKITFNQAKQIVLDSFKQFDPEFFKLAQKFFDKHWIDAPTYAGKRGGAYCMLGSDQKNPRVLLNFTHQHRDILTMAHEIGHGIHTIYAQKQNFFNFYPTIPMAEVGSYANWSDTQ